MNKKIIGSVLALLVMTSFFASCGTNGKAASSDGTNAGKDKSTGTGTAAASETRLYPDLPDTDFGGKEFTFMGTGDAYGYGYYKTKDIWVEEMNGEPLNDAIYERNRNIEEKYNLKIAYKSSDNVYDTVSKSVTAGDFTADAVFGSFVSDMLKLASGGYLLDMGTLKYIDFDKPWWDHNAISNTNIAKRVYYATGEISTLDNGCTRLVYFNKKLVSDNKLDSPYKLVSKNEWTLDNYISMTKSVYADLNGDGVRNEGDRFGTFREGVSPDLLFIGSGQNYVVIDSEGVPEIAQFSDRTFEVIDKIFGMLYDENACLNIDPMKNFGTYSNKYTYARSLFARDQFLFTIGGPLVIDEFRDMESDFGIVPIPKYDGSQESYRSFVDVQTNMAGIPATVPDSGRAAFVLEATAAESMYTVTPVYNETLLKRKYTRDAESADMLDIINVSRVYCLSHVLDIGGVRTLITNAYNAGKVPLYSDYAAVKDSSEAKIKAIYEDYIKEK